MADPYQDLSGYTSCQPIVGIDIQAQLVSKSNPNLLAGNGLVIMTDDKGNELGRMRVLNWSISISHNGIGTKP